MLSDNISDVELAEYDDVVEARRLGDKYWLVEDGIWSVETACQWLTRPTCLQYLEQQGYQIKEPKRRRRR